MATISSLGVGSNLDLSSLLDSLQEAEEGKLAPITARQESYTAKLSAYGSLQSALTTFQTAASKLNDTSLYEGVTASTSGSAFTATADSTAVGGKYSVSVTQLAQAQSLAASGEASSTDTLATADSTITLTIGGSDVSINVSSTDSSLEGIRDAINAAGAGVTATIVNNGDATAPYQLVLSSDSTGTDSAVTNISVTGDTELSALLNYSSVGTGTGMSETVSAQNAQITVNGINITSQSNTVEGAIQGVTLNLNETTGSAPQSLALAKDTEKAKSAISDFVSAYNTLISKVQSLRSVNTEDTDSSGVLVGDSTLRRVEDQVKKALTAQTGTSDSFSYLSQIGVSLQKDGKLGIDDAKLDKALADDMANVGSLLAGASNSTSTSDGVIGGLSTTLTQLLDDNGILANATSGIESTLEDLEKQKDRMQSTIDATVARYKAQFTQLDVLMSTMNSTSDYLTQQFDAMNNTSKS